MKLAPTLIWLAVMSCCSFLHAQATAPSDAPLQSIEKRLADADAFASKLDLKPLRKIIVNDRQTLKTLDSFSREVLEEITGKSSFNSQDPVFTVLDIGYRRGDYDDVNLIKIRSLPLREEFRKLDLLSGPEKDRIVSTGLVSLKFLDQPDVRKLLFAMQSQDMRKLSAYQQLRGSRDRFFALSRMCDNRGVVDLFLSAAVVPPAVAGDDATTWYRLVDVIGASPAMAKMPAGLAPPPAKLTGYTAEKIEPALKAAVGLLVSWSNRDATSVNSFSGKLADALVAVNPGLYPSSTTRDIEVIYNRLAKMTLPGAACYFLAFVCFLASTRSGVGSLRVWGLRLLLLGFFIHTIGIAVRWWLTGSWLPPIKNEFESVMFSAWFGVLVGTWLELWYGRTFLGAAASFVGWLSLIAIFTVPYVFHTSIGENIGQVNGVLMSYWLYIHVTMVTASYSMIGMAFLLSCWWLIRYYLDYGSLSRLPARQLQGGGHGFEPLFPNAGPSAAISLSTTLLRILFLRANERSSVATSIPAIQGEKRVDHSTSPRAIHFLASLDACNLVVLQVAFWTLGIGIVFGAIWADQSWGRPWAWDPKETFALVTWIAYLIIVHVRVATNDKAWWTSVLAVAGFFLMLFNWIGVNYFLVGLHSYAG